VSVTPITSSCDLLLVRRFILVRLVAVLDIHGLGAVAFVVVIAGAAGMGLLAFAAEFGSHVFSF
jgi:hypothetical protein